MTGRRPGRAAVRGTRRPAQRGELAGARQEHRAAEPRSGRSASTRSSCAPTRLLGRCSSRPGSRPARKWVVIENPARPTNHPSSRRAARQAPPSPSPSSSVLRARADATGPPPPLDPRSRPPPDGAGARVPTSSCRGQGAARARQRRCPRDRLRAGRARGAPWPSWTPAAPNVTRALRAQRRHRRRPRRAGVGRFRAHFHPPAGLPGGGARCTGGAGVRPPRLPPAVRAGGDLRGLVLSSPGALARARAPRWRRWCTRINARFRTHRDAEDPIEYVHDDLQAVVTQRRGPDARDFTGALRQVGAREPRRDPHYGGDATPRR